MNSKLLRCLIIIVQLCQEIGGQKGRSKGIYYSLYNRCIPNLHEHYVILDLASFDASFIFKKLGLGASSPKRMMLLMDDHSIENQWGYDVLVKVDKFIFPIDFVILDYE